jgi:RNA polymerase sigma-70 factor (ECF subfamily)
MLVWKSLDILSSRQRTVFLLRFVEELTTSEIAQTVGLTEGAVKCHLSRAVQKVRAALKDK